MDEGQCTVLEAIIPGSHPYLSSEKLWVDNKTSKPVKLVIYDPDGAERIIVTYGAFEYNVELDDSLFTI
jgi:outer membrane lipoprotein-sorting protein